MKKKAAVLCLLGAMAWNTCTVSAAEGTREIPATFRNIKIVVDGKEVPANAEPFIYNGTAYLPIRAVGEAIGKEVSWDARRNTVTLSDPPPMVEMDMDSEEDLEFTLSVTPSGKQERTEILRVKEIERPVMPYGLYYYGLSDVSVTLNGQTLPLAQAMEEGRITVRDILRKGYQDEQDGRAKGEYYRDGGSAQYMYEEYTVIKFNEIAGRRDIYFGIPGMEINALHEQYEYHSPFRSVQDALEQYKAFAEEVPETKQFSVFSNGMNDILSIANRTYATEEECTAAIAELAAACGVELE